jgi:hypothetical protein
MPYTIECFGNVEKCRSTAFLEVEGSGDEIGHSKKSVGGGRLSAKAELELGKDVLFSMFSNVWEDDPFQQFPQGV